MEELEKIESEEKAKIVAETAKIAWKELEVFYARGEVIKVEDGMDLVSVAHAISTDDAEKLETWINEQKILRQFDDDAVEWSANNTEVWGVVIKPWVLIQLNK